MDFSDIMRAVLGSSSTSAPAPAPPTGGSYEPLLSVPPNPMDDPADTIPRQPLNAKALLDSGAIRITHPGNGQGGFTQTDDPSNYSIVTRYNDLNGGTGPWPNKPESYDEAIRDLEAAHQPGPGPLYNGKYNQILWSAKQLGIDPFRQSGR